MAYAKQLQAVQGFLRGTRVLSTYEVTRERQFSQVERSLRNLAGLTATQAGMLLGSVVLRGRAWVLALAASLADMPDRGRELAWCVGAMVLMGDMELDPCV